MASILLAIYRLKYEMKSYQEMVVNKNCQII